MLTLEVDTETIRRLEIKATILRRHIIRMVGVGKTGHIGGSCSVADLVAGLYFSELNVDPGNPKMVGRDRFLLSKGHAALVQYAALAERGFFPLEELERVKTLGSILQGHPDLTKTPGVEANTGSLGQGLSIANGMALAARLDGLDCWFYVVLGDGEINEGQVWEAAMFGAFRRLDHVIAILDKNSLQAMGWVKDRLDTDPIAQKWRSFGWEVQEIDGHNLGQIVAALRMARQARGRPHIVIAHTIKGKGVPFAENNSAFHNGRMTEEQYQLALEGFDRRIAELEKQHE